jgi:hypothetical protein
MPALLDWFFFGLTMDNPLPVATPTVQKRTPFS